MPPRTASIAEVAGPPASEVAGPPRVDGFFGDLARHAARSSAAVQSATRYPGRVKASSLSHVRAPRPLRFPATEPWEERVPEGRRHWILKGFLFRVLRALVGDAGSVGADQFVYFDASDPRRNCAPDEFVKLGVSTDFEVWKTWELGVPELVVEILSPSDTKEKYTLEEKLERFLTLGTQEVVAVNLDAPAGQRLRAWDRLDDDLVERVVTNDTTPCLTLDLHWVIAPADGYPVMLRLARDPAGLELVLSPEERAEARLRDTEARADEAQARADEAEARAAALERELARLRGG